MRRALTTIATLSVALVVYGAIIVMIILRVSRMLIVGILQGTPRSPGPPPLISVAGGEVHAFGHTVPLIAVIGAAAVPPLWWLAATLYDRNLRHTRERLGLCLECGHHLSGRRGRCPQCGERFERTVIPSAPRKSLAHR